MTYAKNFFLKAGHPIHKSKLQRSFAVFVLGNLDNQRIIHWVVFRHREDTDRIPSINRRSFDASAYLDSHISLRKLESIGKTGFRWKWRYAVSSEGRRNIRRITSECELDALTIVQNAGEYRCRPALSWSPRRISRPGRIKTRRSSVLKKLFSATLYERKFFTGRTRPPRRRRRHTKTERGQIGFGGSLLRRNKRSMRWKNRSRPIILAGDL